MLPYREMHRETKTDRKPPLIPIICSDVKFNTKMKARTTKTHSNNVAEERMPGAMQGEEAVNEGGRYHQSNNEDFGKMNKGNASTFAGVLYGCCDARWRSASDEPSRDGGIEGWIHSASPIAAKPQQLMVAVFPWNRDSKGMAAKQG
ncbi:hypothetical protein PIB30_103457 [Stylosanthes scabra]|uniref:Uncharacterized protein n=1 Tax=Stylosanthes scabra TaxID=79078 RepID=A0ABU6VWU2_9FABA|nr:hypothetical protein [Stylosanthes scabra]